MPIRTQWRPILREVNRRCTSLNVFTSVRKGLIVLFCRHTKNMCSKFSADERCQVDSSRDWVSLYTQNRYSTEWESLYPCQNALQYTAYATVFTPQKPLPLHWKCQKYCCLVFIIKESKMWTLLLASVGTELKALAHFKMFIFCAEWLFFQLWTLLRCLEGCKVSPHLVWKCLPIKQHVITTEKTRSGLTFFFPNKIILTYTAIHLVLRN